MMDVKSFEKIRAITYKVIQSRLSSVKSEIDNEATRNSLIWVKQFKLDQTPGLKSLIKDKENEYKRQLIREVLETIKAELEK